MPKLPKLPDLRAAGETWERLKVRAREGVEVATATEYRVAPAMPVRQIHGHVYTTADETRALYVLDDANWSNQPGGDQARIVDLAAAAWEALAGRHVKIRIGDRPLNPWGWAKQYVASARHPAGDKGSLLVEHIYAAGERQLDIGLTSSVVTVDVHLTDAKDGAPEETWVEHEREVLAQLANDALCAKPAPTGTVDWLIHTSLAPGHPAPPPVPGAVLAGDDMSGFTEEVDWFAPVMARAVRIVTHRGVDDPEPVESWAAALTVSMMAPRPSVGPLPPWMSACLQAPFPVQFVASGEIIAARDAAPLFQKRADWQNDQIEHHTEHRMRAPDSVYETYEEARSLADDFANGEAEAMVRFVGRIVVPGETRRQVMDRVRWFKNFYRDDVRVQLLLAKDQVTAIGELCPGVREITRGFQRHAPVSMFAAGVPNVTGVIGQPGGMYLGYTSAPLARRPVYFDPWWPASREGQGAAIYPVLGDPGAGRSTLGLRVIQECILTGDYVVAIDPAGEWSTAAQLVGAPGRVKVLDLSDETVNVAGILAIRRIIPDPNRALFTTVDAYEAACQKVRADRQALAQDALRQIVDDDTWSDPVRRNALKDAAAECDGDLWAAIDWLTRSGHDEFVRLARELTTAAYGPARLLFPHRRVDGSTVPVDVDEDLLGAQVVVITMQGMQFPAPGTDQRHWDSTERASALVMRFAAFLARRLIEVKDQREPRCRKAVIVDEASWLANWVYGTAWIAGFVRHVRRWNCPLFLMTQHPNDLKRLDPEGNTFASGGFVGATAQVEVAEQSLAIIRAAPGLGAICPNLSWTKTPTGRVKIPGEFLWVDAQGRCLRIRLDIEPFPVLKAAADTTPGSPRRAAAGHVVSMHKAVAGPTEEEPPDALAV